MCRVFHGYISPVLACIHVVVKNKPCARVYSSFIVFKYVNLILRKQGGQSRDQHVSQTSKIVHNFRNTKSNFMR